MSCSRSTRKSPLGFVLLIVVVMLAITCLLLYQVASLSFAHVRDAIRFERGRREMWSVVSLRREVLASAAQVLANRERNLNLTGLDSKPPIYTPVREVSFNLALNGIDFQVKLQDENAKLNVPFILTKVPMQSRGILQHATSGSGLGLHPDLFTSPPASDHWDWSDVFSINDWAVTTGRVEHHASFARAQRDLTLWGSGKLNIARANAELLDDVWRGVFGHFPPRELTEACQHYPVPTWDTIRERLDLRQTQLQQADQLFTTTPSCFSLTVLLERANGQTQGWFFVEDRGRNHSGYEF